MLKQSGLYSIKNDEIVIRLPNPNDIIYKWENVNENFKKEFLSTWHDAYVLSKKETEHKIYGIPSIAYRQLIVLDHIGYLVNTNQVTSSFLKCYEEVVNKYSKALDMITLSK